MFTGYNIVMVDKDSSMNVIVLSTGHEVLSIIASVISFTTHKQFQCVACYK